MQELPLKLPERSILVIDDDKRVLQTATEMLRSIGLNPEPVFDEEQGLQLACQRQKAGEGYHMILLDWSLKEPGCIYMIEQLRLQLGNETPVIILFDGDWGEVETDARAAGASGCIAKPLFRSSLYYGLRKYTEEDVGRQPDKEEGQMDFTGRRILMAEDNERSWDGAGLGGEWADLCGEISTVAPVLV